MTSRLTEFGAVLVFITPSLVSAAAPTMEEIYRVWEAHAAKVKSAEVRWSETTFLPKGSQIAFEVPPQSGPLPREDTMVERTGTMFLDGDRFYWETDGSDWSINEADILRITRVASFTGQDFYSHFGLAAESDVGHPVGTIIPDQEGKGLEDATRDPVIWPIFNAFRAAHPRWGDFQHRQWRVSPRWVNLRGRDCVVIQDVRPPDSPSFMRCYLDAGRDYCVLRRELGFRPGAVGGVREIDIEYGDHPVAGIAPTGWTIKQSEMLAEGSLRLEEQTTSVVTEMKLNAPVDRTTFEYEFPPGTEVTDKRKSTEELYIVKADGSQRPILQRERELGVKYRDLIQTEPGGAVRR